MSPFVLVFLLAVSGADSAALRASDRLQAAMQVQRRSDGALEHPLPAAASSPAEWLRGFDWEPLKAWVRGGSYKQFVLYGLACCVILACIVLSIVWVYDAMLHYQHRMHFKKCEQKVMRVHDALQNKTGALPLCPCCINEVPMKASPNALVFLCGHRFHTTCANNLFLKQRTQCPICEAPPPMQCYPCDEGGSVDPTNEAKTFFLQSLHEQYPEIIPKSSAKRWVSCHTEIWLSELECPKYNSIFPARCGGMAM